MQKFSIHEDTPRLLTPKNTYTVDYPTAIKYAETQMDIFWSPNEIAVEKDIQDLKTNFTEAETHGVITTLKLFTQYELVVGNEYWSGRIKSLFKRPDIQRMANCFSFFELNVHAPFYDKLNQALGIATDEFYLSYVDDPVLRGRMEWINMVVGKNTDNIYDILKSIAVFSMIEGAILYSSFAFLKHFQSEGKSKLVNITSGINFSVRDENLHSQAGAWLYKVLLNESKVSKDEKVLKRLQEDIIETAHQIVMHENRIIDMIFERGNIKGITDIQMKNFVESRLDLCLEQLEIEKIYKPTYNPIAKSFYKNLTSGHLHDFFHRLGSAYNRNWNEKAFVWKTSDE